MSCNCIDGNDPHKSSLLRHHKPGEYDDAVDNYIQCLIRTSQSEKKFVIALLVTNSLKSVMAESITDN